MSKPSGQCAADKARTSRDQNVFTFRLFLPQNNTFSYRLNSLALKPRLASSMGAAKVFSLSISGRLVQNAISAS